MGLGSFGCIVAEAIACEAVSKIILIDPSAVEEHELNRLLYLSHLYLGQHIVELFWRNIRDHTSGNDIQITALPLSTQEKRT